jgi:hypothetical protein
LLISPGAAPWLGAPGAEEHEPRWSVAVPHPILAGIDLRTLTIARATAFAGPGLEVAARTERGTPLVLVSDAADRRLAVLTFTAADSNLATAAAFPVLMGNLIEWLARPGDGETRRPGRVYLPASTVRILGPDGADVPMTRAGDGVTAVLAEPGVYTVEGGGAERRIAVNVGDPDVSNVSRSTVAASSTTLASGGRPWWLYALVAAFVLACVEWWTWHRRVTV